MKHKKYRNNRAYTLIQLLLIIAVMSAVTVSGFAFFENTGNSQRTNKTAIEIQRLSEAAVIYYGSNRRYPNNYGELKTAGLAPTIGTSLNEGKNPWGKDYIFSNNSIRFFIKTDVVNPRDATKLSRILPYGTQSGSNVESRISLEGKAVAPHNEKLLIRIQRSVAIGNGTVNRHNINATATDDQCAKLGRAGKGKITPLLTGYTLGSMFGGHHSARGISAYVPHDYKEVYLTSGKDGNNYYVEIHAGYNDWSSIYSTKIYGQATILYYCDV